MKDQELIHRLAQQLTPTPWHARRAARIILWSVGITVYFLAAVATMSGPPLLAVISPMLIVQTAALLGIALLCGASAILLAVPGERVPRLWWTTLLAIGALLIFVVASLDPNSLPEALLSHAHDGMNCAGGVLGWALPPALAGVLLLRARMVLRSGVAAFFLFLSAGAIGTAILQFGCLSQNPVHVFVAHLAPVAALGAFGAAIGGRVLAWKSSVAERTEK